MTHHAPPDESTTTNEERYAVWHRKREDLKLSLMTIEWLRVKSISNVSALFYMGFEGCGPRSHTFFLEFG